MLKASANQVSHCGHPDQPFPGLWGGGLKPGWEKEWAPMSYEAVILSRASGEIVNSRPTSRPSPIAPVPLALFLPRVIYKPIILRRDCFLFHIIQIFSQATSVFLLASSGLRQSQGAAATPSGGWRPRWVLLRSFWHLWEPKSCLKSTEYQGPLWGSRSCRCGQKGLGNH